MLFRSVGLINALHRVTTNRNIDVNELAELASYIEITKCNEPIGKQDQFAAAYGGFNTIHFEGGKTRVKHLDVDQITLLELNNNLIAFNTGISRNASSILTKQVENIKSINSVENTKAMVEMAKQAVKLLQKRKIDDFGYLLDQAWQVKKKLSDNISNEEIDKMYDIAMNNGALGGKVLGAGGGGYLLTYVPDKSKNRLLEAMKKYQRFNFKFSKQGSRSEEHTSELQSH